MKKVNNPDPIINEVIMLLQCLETDEREFVCAFARERVRYARVSREFQRVKELKERLKQKEAALDRQLGFQGQITKVVTKREPQKEFNA